MTSTWWAITGLVIVIITIAIIAVRLGGHENQKNGGGKPRTGTWFKSLNFLQGWSAKRIFKWALLSYLLFELGVLAFDIPDFSLIRKLVDVAYRKEPQHIYNGIVKRQKSLELEKHLAVLSEVENSDNPLNRENRRKANEAIEEINKINLRYTSILERQYYYIWEEGETKVRRKAYIVAFSEERLTFTYYPLQGEEKFVTRTMDLWRKNDGTYYGERQLKEDDRPYFILKLWLTPEIDEQGNFTGNFEGRSKVWDYKSLIFREQRVFLKS